MPGFVYQVCSHKTHLGYPWSLHHRLEVHVFLCMNSYEFRMSESLQAETFAHFILKVFSYKENLNIKI